MQESGYSQVTPEEFLDHYGVEYRETSGSRGRQYNIRECPKCGGDKWKVYLSTETGYGNCFHGDCEEKYNLWTFAKACLDTDDNVAVGRMFDEIAKGSGWKPKPKKREITPVITGELKLPHGLPVPDENIEYLTDRGITAKTAQHFGFKNCIQGAFRFKRENGDDGLMPFSGRLIIPIKDLDGKLVTFQGRDTTGKKDPKYLFPPRLPSTARFLYNGHSAYARQSSHIVMSEGALDVAAVHQAIEPFAEFVGTTAVGSFGKHLTLDPDPDHTTQLEALLALKERGLKKITILWDGEPSAVVAACKAADQLERYGFEVYIAFLPKGKDPAEVEPVTVRKAILKALKYDKKLALRLRFNNPYG